MKVSILIPIYNKDRYIDGTINSALNQSWPNKEIIIVDDGSTDDSYKIAKSYNSNMVKVYRQKNSGAANARNIAFRKSTGDYIQYLDADDLMDADKIKFQMELLFKYNYDPDILVFGGWLEFDDGKDLDFTIRRDHKCLKDYIPAYEAIIQCWKVSFPLIPIHTFLIPRGLIEKAGEWREYYKKHEDCEFFARLLFYSKNLVCCKSSMVYYRNVEGSLSKPNSSEKIFSELQVIREITEIILSRTTSVDAKYACSLHYTEFIESRYPLNKPYLDDAYNDLKKYGLSFLTSHRGYSYKLLYALFGWRMTKQLLKPYSYIKNSVKRKCSFIQ